MPSNDKMAEAKEQVLEQLEDLDRLISHFEGVLYAQGEDRLEPDWGIVQHLEILRESKKCVLALNDIVGLINEHTDHLLVTKDMLTQVVIDRVVDSK